MKFNIRVPRYWRSRGFLYRLEGSRCVSCGEFHAFTRLACRRCRSRNLVPDRLPERGKLLDFTVIHQAPPLYENGLPYVVGLVEMLDGSRLLAQITDCDVDELTLGMEVELTFRRLRTDGEANIISYGYKFRPIIQ
ncbi:MAG: Zn-ribbon domain-containing OB-fold protein [Nitrososphaerota archaeon]